MPQWGGVPIPSSWSNDVIGASATAGVRRAAVCGGDTRPRVGPCGGEGVSGAPTADGKGLAREGARPAEGPEEAGFGEPGRSPRPA